MSKKTRTTSNKSGKLMKCDGQMLKKVIEAKGYKCHELSKMLRYCSDYLTTCCRQNKISDVAAKYLMDYKIFPQMYDLEGEIKVDEPKEVKIDKDEKKYIESDKKATYDLKKKMDMNVKNSTYGVPKETAFYTKYGVICSEKDLRDCIKRATDPKAPLWGSNLAVVRNILEKACNNGLKYNIEDMRNDLLVYATKVTHPENWVHFVDHLNLRYDPSIQDIKDRINEAKEILNRRYGTHNLRSAAKSLAMGIDYGYDHASKNASYCDYYAAGHTIGKGLFQLIHAAVNDLKDDPEFKEIIKQAVKEAYEEL